MDFLKKIICDSDNKRKGINNNSLGNNGANSSSLPNAQYQNMNYTGSSAGSSLLFQENVNPNKNLKSSYLTSTKNNFNTSRNSAYGTHTVNPESYFNKSNKFNTFGNLKKKTESSGKLLKSEISSKHNKVIKDNGNKIQNIDMNDDCEDTMNNSFNNPKNNLRPINSSLMPNNKQSINTSVQPKQSIQSINNNSLSSRIPIPINTNNKSQLQPRPSIKSTDGMTKRPILNDNKSVKSKKEDDTRSRKSSFSVAPFQKLSHSEVFTKSYSTGIYIDADTTSINPLLMKMQNKKGKGFKYCSDLSRAGKDADQNIKIDQDTSLISLNVGGLEGFNLFGVLDGHGQHGHFVSQFLKDYFINNICALFFNLHAK